MTYENEKKMEAAKKIAIGVYECASGGLLAAGHGVVAAFIRTPHLRMPIARHMLQSGQKSLKEGLDDWKKATH